jgi:hypothetical protein
MRQFAFSARSPAAGSRQTYIRIQTLLAIILVSNDHDIGRAVGFQPRNVSYLLIPMNHETSQLMNTDLAL